MAATDFVKFYLCHKSFSICETLVILVSKRMFYLLSNPNKVMKFILTILIQVKYNICFVMINQMYPRNVNHVIYFISTSDLQKLISLL